MPDKKIKLNGIKTCNCYSYQGNNTSLHFYTVANAENKTH